MPTGFELSWVADRGDDRRRRNDANTRNAGKPTAGLHLASNTPEVVVNARELFADRAKFLDEMAQCSSRQQWHSTVLLVFHDQRQHADIMSACGCDEAQLGQAIRYVLSRWDGLCRFVDDGRFEIDNNIVERSIRPIALTRKNALFAGSDGGAEHWAVVASLIETCKLCNVDPQVYLADTITRIVNDHPNSRLDDLMPWRYATATEPVG